MKTYSSTAGKERLRYITHCTLCNSYEHKPIISGDGFLFVKCNSCGLVFQNPQPGEIELRERYGGDYFRYEKDNEKNFFNLMLLGLRDIGFNKIASQLNGKKSFLDVGCATGMLIHHMKSNGWAEQGVEICRPSAIYGIRDKGVKIFIGTLEEACFEPESFNVIHCSHLIEHLTDPLRFFTEVFRILKPGGFFIVTTPNIDGFQARLFKEKWRSAIADHMYLFSRKTIEKLFHRTGFKVLKSKTWGGLAKGTAPAIVKGFADFLAKKMGIGDVMIYLTQKGPTVKLKEPSA
ncbi:MAG: class I SAM-dependent methyltransferase [Spirochaetes bacterium]|nr:MAG: class I SAM-dependent methyltransferase [Spirochaetota bacterium]